MTAATRGRIGEGALAVLARTVLTGTVAGSLLAVAGCAAQPRPSEAPPHRGGTLYYLRSGAGFVHLDPQRDFFPQDQAFASGYLQRTLTAYAFTARAGAATLVPDLATDTGRPSPDARTWTFTIRAGARFQNGQPIGCADVKYGVSRAFASTVLSDTSASAVGMLDIPRDAGGSPVYRGPYPVPGNDTAAFDRAVECSPDGRTITFHLNRPVADFDSTVALLTYSPVPHDLDTGARYDGNPYSSGPYEIAQKLPGKRLVLVRNPQWSKASDPYRPAYPDRIVAEIGVPDTQIRQRLTADTGPDRTAVASLSPASARSVFADRRLAGRRYDGPNGYVDYLAINTARLPDVRQRQAIAAALDVAALNTAAGGNLAGPRADGLISPALGPDYQPTGLWDGLLGEKIGAHGDPSYARALIARSGRPMPTLSYDYIQSSTAEHAASIVVSSLARAGITVTPHPLSPGGYYATVRDPKTAGDLMAGAAGPDWNTASTIVADLLTPSGTLNLSEYDDAGTNRQVQRGQAELDRSARARQWAALNRAAMERALAVPLRFEHSQALVGSRVGGAYSWAPCGCLPFGALWVKP